MDWQPFLTCHKLTHVNVHCKSLPLVSLCFSALALITIKTKFSLNVPFRKVNVCMSTSVSLSPTFEASGLPQVVQSHWDSVSSSKLNTFFHLITECLIIQHLSEMSAVEHAHRPQIYNQYVIILIAFVI